MLLNNLTNQELINMALVSTDNKYALALAYKLELADNEIIELGDSVEELDKTIEVNHLDSIRQANLINDLKQDNAKVKGLKKKI